MKYLTNLSFTLLLIVIFPLLDSCDDINQECGGSFTDYYDYAAIDIEQAENHNNEEGDYFYFMVSPIFDFETRMTPTSFGSSLMADNVMLLPKHEIQTINILSDKAFDSSLPDVLTITDNFEFYSYTESAWQAMDLAQFDQSSQLYLRCTVMPDNMDQLYDLKIEITKSDGEMASGVLTKINFTKE